MALWDLALAQVADSSAGDGGQGSVSGLTREAESGVPVGAPAVGPAGAGHERELYVPQTRPSPLRGATTILVVENDEAQAIAVCAGLEHEGFAPIWAGDGVSGLELFNAKAPNVVIVDAMLPGLSGIDVCRRVKQMLSSVPVIVVS